MATAIAFLGVTMVYSLNEVRVVVVV